MTNLYHYSRVHIAEYHGWLLHSYDTPIIRQQLERLLRSRFAGQAPLRNSQDREIYHIAPSSSERSSDTLDAYLKRYRVTTWKAKLQSFFRSHKAQKAFRIANRLRQKHIATPQPVALLSRYCLGVPCEHLLLTKTLSNGLSLAEYVERWTPESVRTLAGRREKRRLIRRVAHFLAHLHQQGVYHGDFTAPNLFVQPQTSCGSSEEPDSGFRIFLLDLDAIRSTRGISQRRRLKNLDEIGRNFPNRRIISTPDRLRFLHAYVSAFASEILPFKALFYTILHRTQAQLYRHQKHFTPPFRASLSTSPPHWQLHVMPGWQAIFPAVGTVWNLLNSPLKVIQENNRGVVLLLRHHATLFIAKRSKIQERRRWAQLTSLYRHGEATRTMGNMQRLYVLGLPVPEPVLVLEKKRFGFTLASWSLYRYVEGTACTCEQAAYIARMLQRMHRHGWVHRDPHVKNFLLHEDELYIIDCARARPWASRYRQMYDVLLLNNCCPGSFRHYGITEQNGFYQLARLHHRLIKFWRRLKRLLYHKKYRTRNQ